MLTNLFASDEKVFLQFPVSHPFSYLTNWMQFSTRSLHKRFVRAAQKKTNKWFILLMTLKLKKTVENCWKREHCKERIQNQKPEPEVFFVIYSLKEFKFEDDYYGPVERNHIGSDTQPKLFLFWFDIYFCWLFFLNWFLFAAGKST